MRANLRRLLDGEETGPILQLHGEYRTLTNLICYGVYPFAIQELGMQDGDKLAAHVYSSPDLSREGKPDKKIVVTIGSIVQQDT